MIVKFTDNFLMIRGLITVLSALKMRNFTWIFPKIFAPPRPPQGRGASPPPTKIASCAPAFKDVKQYVVHDNLLFGQQF